MKKITLFMLLFSYISTYSQKILKDYYPYTSKVKVIYQVDNKTGVKNGIFKTYFQNGQLYETGSYKMGNKDGIWTTYDENGTGLVSSTTSFKNGKQHGVYKQYCFEKGKRYLCGDYMYNDNKKISSTTYYNNGKKKSEIKHGIENYWFKDGTPQKETKDGKTFTTEEETREEEIVGKYYSMIEFDSVGFHFMTYIDSIGTQFTSYNYDSVGYHFIYYYKPLVGYEYDKDLRRSVPYIKQIIITSIIMTDIPTNGYNFYHKWSFDNLLMNEYQATFVLREDKLNSSAIKMGYDLRNKDPYPGLTKTIGVYDVITGNVEFFTDGNPQMSYIKTTDEKGKILRRFVWKEKEN